MHLTTDPPAVAATRRPLRWQLVAYWLVTGLVVSELLVGGAWDIARLPLVATLVQHLGYPGYFLVLLGTWKILGAAAILVPGRPLLKEWAYAGTVFVYSGAIISHLAAGYARGEIAILAPLLVLSVLSWALRPASRTLVPLLAR